MNGSASRYWPEIGSTSGVVQWLFSKCETTMVQKLKVGLLRRKYRVLPSGVKAGCESKSPVEMTPLAKIVGSGSGCFEAYGGSEILSHERASKTQKIEIVRRIINEVMRSCRSDKCRRDCCRRPATCLTALCSSGAWAADLRNRSHVCWSNRKCDDPRRRGARNRCRAS